MNREELNKQIEELVLKMAQEPHNVDNYHRLSELYLQIEDYDKVMSVLESLLTIKPDDVQALVGMGTMWFYEKDFRKSLSYYNKALETYKTLKKDFPLSNEAFEINKNIAYLEEKMK